MLLLAFSELRRAKVRFAMLMGAIALLVFLILFQQALQQGLLTGFVGAIRTQSAPVLVYSVDGQRVIQASVIDPELARLVRDTPEAAAAGYLGQGSFSVTAADELVEASIIGYESTELGAPTSLVAGRLPEAPGEAVASDADAGRGFDVGDAITVEPGGLKIEIVGLASEAQLSVSATLFVGYDTYLEAVAARSPGGGEPLPNVLGVVPAEGVSDDELVDALNARDDRIDALTRDQAADATPGVAQVRQSFRIIFALYAFVVPLVTGLFFLIVTIQKARALTVLRAVGAMRLRLVGALLIQVAIIAIGGVLIGAGLFALIVAAGATSLSLRFDVVNVSTWGALVVALGVISSMLAVRRVTAIEPVTAATGGGAR